MCFFLFYFFRLYINGNHQEYNMSKKILITYKFNSYVSSVRIDYNVIFHLLRKKIQLITLHRFNKELNSTIMGVQDIGHSKSF